MENYPLQEEEHTSQVLEHTPSTYITRSLYRALLGS